ncbi:YcaO-like family protein [Vibrio splendidus]|uniref:YcaO-like family protein n=1 Tax=Vibrio splendidus TaxID=29497 RepID=UPI000C821F47|nr:YcaO-like family protein [Vibrio splendidus]PMP38707.1 hypothetical protein BCS86_03125 [Vibrio splendidus]
MKPEIVSSINTLISGVPVNTYTYVNYFDEHIFCSVSGINVIHGNQSDFFFGHSLSQSKEQSEKASQYEAIERFFCSKVMLKKVNYALLDLNREITDIEISREDIAIRTERDNGSTGSAAHITIDDAVKHGIFEVMERHILSTMWYEGFTLVPIEKKETLKDGYEINYYTTEELTCFVIAVVSHEEKTLFMSGSSMSDSIRVSKVKARNEALMLLNNHIEGKLEISGATELTRASSVNNFRRLTQCHASDIHSHFNKQVSKSIKAKRHTICLNDQLASLGFAKGDIRFAVLHEEKDVCVVRVFVENANTKESLRKKYKGIIHDPFC